MEELTVQKQVENGVAWLDENGPAEWWERIDYSMLDISDGNLCVLGQVFEANAFEVGIMNGYTFVARNYFDSGEGYTDTDAVTENGFMVIYDDYVVNYASEIAADNELRDAWIDAIEARRAEVNA